MLYLIALFRLLLPLSAICASVIYPTQGTTALDNRLFAILEPTVLSNVSILPSKVAFSIGSDLTISPNISAVRLQHTGFSPSNLVHIRCDPTKPANFLSCRNALGYTSIDDEQTTFAQRNTGVPADVPLPYRITGGE